MKPMQVNQSFGRGLAKGIYRALHLWAHWNPKRIALLVQRALLIRRAAGKRDRIFKEKGIMVPPLIILSATMECNLTCIGCYSRSYSLQDEMSIEELDHLFTEAEQSGVAFFVITGGEPLMKKGMLDLMMAHPNLIFLMFTNGTCVSQPIVNQIKKVCHIIPMLSVEGDETWTDERRGEGIYAQVMTAMARLKQADVFFGFSTVVTTRNLALLKTDGYYQSLTEKGCGLGLLVGYVPGDAFSCDPLIVSKSDQIELRKHVRKIQNSGSIILMQMPEDEYARGGVCMAAGRGFVHITAQGFVEPCPFSHYATHSLRENTLLEALDSPYFAHIRSLPCLEGSPQRGCALVEIEEELVEQTRHLGVRSTEGIMDSVSS